MLQKVTDVDPLRGHLLVMRGSNFWRTASRCEALLSVSKDERGRVGVLAVARKHMDLAVRP